MVDVRDLDNAFAKGHFRGFINYDIEKGNMDEFIYRIESMYSKDKTIFIIDEDGSWVQQLQQALKKAKYKKVIIYYIKKSRGFLPLLWCAFKDLNPGPPS